MAARIIEQPFLLESVLNVVIMNFEHFFIKN